MGLHDGQFVLLGVSNELLDEVFHSINEVLEVHLVLVVAGTHDLDEDEVVIVPGDLLAGHASEEGEFGELRGRKHLLTPDSAVAVEDSKHVLNNVHLLDLFTLYVQHLLPGVVMLPNTHVTLLLQTAPHQI